MTEVKKKAHEVTLAARLLHQLTGEASCLVETPDSPNSRSRDEGWPDAVFETRSGGKYVVEVSRLLLPSVRRTTAVMLELVVQPLIAPVVGTYLLQCPVQQRSQRGITAQVAESVRVRIEAALRGGATPDAVKLPHGFELVRIKHDGSKIHVGTIGQELPPVLDDRDTVPGQLMKEFQTQLSQVDKKFTGFSPMRLWLLDTGQSGLVLDIHIVHPQGAVRRWLGEVESKISNIDQIYIDPGVGPSLLGPADGGQNVRWLDGHRYVDVPRGYFLRLWPPSDAENT